MHSMLIGAMAPRQCGSRPRLIVLKSVTMASATIEISWSISGYRAEPRPTLPVENTTVCSHGTRRF